MSEHLVLVAFDVEAADRESAHRAVVDALSFKAADEGSVPHQVIRQALQEAGVDSWWLPEADVKHIDGNDNAPMRLVPDLRRPTETYVRPRPNEVQAAALQNLCERYGVSYSPDDYMVWPEDSSMMPGWAEGWVGGQRHSDNWRHKDPPAGHRTIFVGVSPEGEVHS